MIEWILIALCVVIALCPPKYDTAIKFKEANYNFVKFLEIWGK